MDLFQSKIAYCMNERLQDSFILKDCLILSFWKNKQSFKIKEPAIFHSYNTQSLIERSQHYFWHNLWIWKLWVGFPYLSNFISEIKCIWLTSSFWHGTCHMPLFALHTQSALRSNSKRTGMILVRSTSSFLSLYSCEQYNFWGELRIKLRKRNNHLF